MMVHMYRIVVVYYSTQVSVVLPCPYACVLFCLFFLSVEGSQGTIYVTTAVYIVLYGYKLPLVFTFQLPYEFQFLTLEANNHIR